MTIFSQKRIRNALNHLRKAYPKRPPDFLIVGATRCGTSYLHAVLDAHPDVFVPQGMKELKYFNSDRKYRSDLSGYARLFNGYDGQKIYGEATPLYWETGFGFDAEDRFHGAYEGDVMGRVAAAMPEGRIVITLRNPQDRLVSIYRKNVGQKRMKATLQEEIDAGRADPEASLLLRRIRYADNLEHVLRLFGPERVHVMVFEEWTAEPDMHLNKMAAFLGVSSRQTWSGGQSKKARNAAERYMEDDAGAPDTQLDADTTAWLSAHCAADIARCEELLGRALPWQV